MLAFGSIDLGHVILASLAALNLFLLKRALARVASKAKVKRLAKSQKQMFARVIALEERERERSEGGRHGHA